MADTIKIKKIKITGEYIYPATILDAVKDATAKITVDGVEKDNPTYGKTVREIIEDNEKVTAAALTELDTRVGALSDLNTSDKTSVVKAINSAMSASTTEVIESTGISVATSTDETDGHTKYTISNDLDLVYVAAVANTAAEGEASNATPAKINLIDKSDKTVIGTVNVSDIVGNGVLDSSAYDESTGVLTLNFKNSDGSTTAQTIDLAKMLDINDMSVADVSKNYLSVDLTGAENSQAVFSANVVKMADAKAAELYTAEDEAADATHVAGTVKTAATTGLADAADVKTYVDELAGDLNVTSNVSDAVAGITVEVDETSGKVTKPVVTVTGGSVADGNTSVVTGGTVYTAIKDKVESLDVENNTSDAVAGIAVQVDETDGKVQKPVVTVTEGAIEKDNASVVKGGTIYNYALTCEAATDTTDYADVF